jgi:hypothetical protein
VLRVSPKRLYLSTSLRGITSLGLPKKNRAEKLCNVYIKLANLALTVYNSVVFGVERQKLLHVGKQRAKTRYIIHV